MFDPQACSNMQIAWRSKEKAGDLGATPTLFHGQASGAVLVGLIDTHASQM